MNLDLSFLKPSEQASFLTSAQKEPFAFQACAQFSLLTDILSRKQIHHAILYHRASRFIYHAFMDAFLSYLKETAHPPFLRQVDILFFDVEAFYLQQLQTKSQVVIKQLQRLQMILDEASHLTLVVLSNINGLSAKTDMKDHLLFKYIQLVCTHKKSRLVLFNPQELTGLFYRTHFATIKLANLSDTDTKLLLAREKKVLEDYHQIEIQEKALQTATILIKRYQGETNLLENTLLLLDSSAARVRVEPTTFQETRPQVTSQTIFTVFGEWTALPASHLIAKFNKQAFIQQLQQELIGQEVAVQLIANHLQQAHAPLHKNVGPFHKFFFAGPKQTGKKTAALALVKNLFQQTHLLYTIDLNKHCPSQLSKLKLQNQNDKQYRSIDTILKQTPFAVLLFTNIEEAPAALIDHFEEMITAGSYSTSSSFMDFKQTILIFTTALGSSRLPHTSITEETQQTFDLLQLLSQSQATSQKAKEVCPNSLVNEMTIEISETFPRLAEQMPVIPFVPLDDNALQQILRLKLKNLGKEMYESLRIELSYAPEVLRYLTTEAKHHAPNSGCTYILKQVDACIQQAILHKTVAYCPAQLFLQLNETGEQIRGDWLALTSAREHTA